MIPLAKLVSNGESKSELVKKLSERQDISKIEVCSGEKVIASHQFPPKIERYFVKGRNLESKDKLIMGIGIALILAIFFLTIYFRSGLLNS